VQGGKIYGDWPGLGPDQLDEVGDLRVVNDYRDVFAEALAVRMGNPDVNAVFPNRPGKRFGMFV